LTEESEFQVRLVSGLIACLALMPLVAQADVESDFTALKTAIPALPVLPGPANPITETKAMIAGLQGDWAPFSTLAGGYEMPDPAIIPKACERVAYRIEPVGDLGLTITQGMGEHIAVTRLLYAGFGTFAALPDEASWMKRLFGEKVAEVDELNRLRAVTMNRFMSDVILLPSGENLLVVLTPRYPAEVWSRCP
jgi:hypothetical protein